MSTAKQRHRRRRRIWTRQKRAREIAMDARIIALSKKHGGNVSLVMKEIWSDSHFSPLTKKQRRRMDRVGFVSKGLTFAFGDVP